MVRGELPLERSPLLVFELGDRRVRTDHDAGAVDEDVDLLDLGVRQDLGRRGAHGGRAGQIQGHKFHLHFGVQVLDRGDDRVDLGLRAAWEDDLGWGPVAGQRDGRLGSDGVCARAGDEDCCFVSGY